nr:hypothetical protein [Tanacetum cinerariifolium]
MVNNHNHSENRFHTTQMSMSGAVEVGKKNQVFPHKKWDQGYGQTRLRNSHWSTWHSSDITSGHAGDPEVSHWLNGRGRDLRAKKDGFGVCY